MRRWILLQVFDNGSGIGITRGRSCQIDLFVRRKIRALQMALEVHERQRRLGTVVPLVPLDSRGSTLFSSCGGTCGAQTVLDLLKYFPQRTTAEICGWCCVSMGVKPLLCCSSVFVPVALTPNDCVPTYLPISGSDLILL